MVFSTLDGWPNTCLICLKINNLDGSDAKLKAVSYDGFVDTSWIRKHRSGNSCQHKIAHGGDHTEASQRKAGLYIFQQLVLVRIFLNLCIARFNPYIIKGIFCFSVDPSIITPKIPSSTFSPPKSRNLSLTIPYNFCTSGGQVARWPDGQVARWPGGRWQLARKKWGIPEKSIQNVAQQASWNYLCRTLQAKVMAENHVLGNRPLYFTL